MEAENLIRKEPPQFKVPKEIVSINSLSEIEVVVGKLRDVWQWGTGPIKDLIQLCEEKGLRICVIEAPRPFDACTLTINGNPAIIVKQNIPGDQQRFYLAHELGHLILKLTPDLDAEEAANRFAGAFLIPKEKLFLELGAKRHKISINELFLIKHKYGITMEALVFRAFNLDIISEQNKIKLLRKIRSISPEKVELGTEYPQEKRFYLRQLVFKGIALDIISTLKAAELSNVPLSQIE